MSNGILANSILYHGQSTMDLSVHGYNPEEAYGSENNNPNVSMNFSTSCYSTKRQSTHLQFSYPGIHFTSQPISDLDDSENHYAEQQNIPFNSNGQNHFLVPISPLDDHYTSQSQSDFDLIQTLAPLSSGDDHSTLPHTTQTSDQCNDSFQNILLDSTFYPVQSADSHSYSSSHDDYVNIDTGSTEMELDTDSTDDTEWLSSYSGSQYSPQGSPQSHSHSILQQIFLPIETPLRVCLHLPPRVDTSAAQCTDTDSTMHLPHRVSHDHSWSDRQWFKVLISPGSSPKHQGTLIVSNSECVDDNSWLTSHRIQAILNCSPIESSELTTANSVKYVERLATSENESIDELLKHFRTGSDFVQLHLAKNRTVLVYCNDDMSWSSTIAFSYLIRFENFDLQACRDLASFLGFSLNLSPSSEGALIECHCKSLTQLSFQKPPVPFPTTGSKRAMDNSERSSFLSPVTPPAESPIPLSLLIASIPAKSRLLASKLDPNSSWISTSISGNSFTLPPLAGPLNLSPRCDIIIKNIEWATAHLHRVGSPAENTEYLFEASHFNPEPLPKIWLVGPPSLEVNM